MNLFTPVQTPPLPFSFSLQDRIMVLGSCFAERTGSRMKECGFDVCINPFGTLYNPESILKSLERLESGVPFYMDDCVEMGAGAGRICSFFHHTSFSRESGEDFLKNANDSLREASEFWKGCNRLIVTFGTAMVWKHGGNVVSNCLKRPASEFTHEMLSVEQASSCISDILRITGSRGVLLTVSPIRHLGGGAHQNTLSKATLQLAADKALAAFPGAAYFPSYEIMLDELRDYRFCADDLCHPSEMAVEYIWDKFVQSSVPESEHDTLKANRKQARRQSHRSILK